MPTNSIDEIASAYSDFTQRFKLLIRKNPNLITVTLSNIFTMRLIGNKTHGDLAEIAITEFINQYMEGYSAIHVGKENYRAKKSEEDIEVTDASNNNKFTISLKAYGHASLQLSTDKDSSMFNQLEKHDFKIVDKYIFEVRYGDKKANALQRGLWTNTKNGRKYFDSLTDGWIDYSHNLTLVRLFSQALLSTSQGHEASIIELQRDIEEQKRQAGLS